ncbi:MAG: hypothetical protein ACOX5T_05075 [Candidatus Cryptobacteroides sp.]
MPILPQRSCLQASTGHDPVAVLRKSFRPFSGVPCNELDESPLSWAEAAPAAERLRRHELDKSPLSRAEAAPAAERLRRHEFDEERRGLPGGESRAFHRGILAATRPLFPKPVAGVSGSGRQAP